MSDPPPDATPPKPKRQPDRPDYRRLRKFLKAGGVLQREIIESPGQDEPTEPAAETASPRPGYRYIVWHAAARDGRSFDADTCEWFRMLPYFSLDGAEGWLEEYPAGIFKRVPDIHPTMGDVADQTPDDEEGP